MKQQPVIPAILVLISAGPIAAQTPLGSEFTYQGQLQASGLPVISTADFQFALFDNVTVGGQIGATLASNNVAMTNGAFTVSLDFGVTAFNGEARWLEVAVRSPSGAGGFTTLSPRQLLAATPNATFSAQTRGITVDTAGQVGIGTTTPGKRLTVAGDMEIATASGEFRQLRIGGGNTDGFLYSGLNFGFFPQGGDGIHLSYNHFLDAAGNSHVINPLFRTSRLSLRDGKIALATAAGAQTPTERLIVDQEGNVEISGQLTVIDKIEALEFKNHGQMEVIGGEQGTNQPTHLIWKLGDYETFVNGQIGFIKNPELKMISPVTSDELAGFYRDFDTGNGVMFADDKNFRAPNPADPATDIWYCCPEGPEAAMYVRGSARLIQGKATIELPDHFRNLASESGMTIQLTPLGAESRGLAAVKKRLDGIEVVELGGGTGNYEFDWRVEAVRKGWEEYKVIRPWVHSDPDPDRAWQNRLKHIEERRAHGKPSPAVNADTPRPSN